MLVARPPKSLALAKPHCGDMPTVGEFPSSGLLPGNVATMWTPTFNGPPQRKRSVTVESVPRSTGLTSSVKSSSCPSITLERTSSLTSVVASVSGGRDWRLFWRDFIRVRSYTLSSPIRTDLPTSVLNSSNGWSSKMAGRSRFWTARSTAPDRN